MRRATFYRGRVASLLEELGGIGRTTDGISRLAYTFDEQAARDWLLRHLEQVCDYVQVDPYGNVLGRIDGLSNGRAIGTGSHLDTVPHGGPLDGALGIASALAIFMWIRRNNLKPLRPLVLCGFSAEESARFGKAMLGSRGAIGTLVSDDAFLVDLLTGQRRLIDDMKELGLRPPFDPVPLPWIENLSAFFELHIDQGSELNQCEVPVAIASRVAASAKLVVAFEGPGGHAGAADPATRRDPLLAGTRYVREAMRLGEQHRVRSTAGAFSVSPNAINSIPQSVHVGLDIRSLDRSEHQLNRTMSSMKEAARQSAAASGVTWRVIRESQSPSFEFSQMLNLTIRQAAAELGLKPPIISSWAGHDAAIVGTHVPSAMILVRNRSELSHHPGETTSLEDICSGALLLDEVLRLTAGY